MREVLVDRNRTNLEISKLGESLATPIEPTAIWLVLIVDDPVGADVATLSESFPTNFTWIWAFTCMATLVGLKSCN